MKDTVKVLKALGDETRLRIAALLYLKGELCVCEIMSAISMKQSAISKALKVLKEADLINDKKKAQWVYYSININKDAGNQGYTLLQVAVKGMEKEGSVRADLSRAAEYNKNICKGK